MVVWLTGSAFGEGPAISSLPADARVDCGSFEGMVIAAATYTESTEVTVCEWIENDCLITWALQPGQTAPSDWPCD